MKKIYLTKGQVTIVDDNDYKWLNQWKWQYSPGGYATRRGPRPKQTSIFMSRLIINPLKNFEVDHINGNRLDNRRCNLRICTRLQNARNRRKPNHNTSGYKGVSFHKLRQKWEGYIRINGKKQHLGLFLTAIEAAKAYDTAVKQYYKEFAVFNF